MAANLIELFFSGIWSKLPAIAHVRLPTIVEDYGEHAAREIVPHRLRVIDDDQGELARMLWKMRPVLSDLQSKDGRHSRETEIQLEKLRSIGLDLEAFLDKTARKLQYSSMKVPSFFPSSRRQKMAHKIRTTVSSLKETYEQLEEIMDDEAIVGRENDISEVIGMLMGSDYVDELPVISIVGMGGVGKTTLAKQLYNHPQVQGHFRIRMWTCVSEIYEVDRILNDMLQCVRRTGYETTGKEATVQRLREFLQDTRYLLVLDDVWDKSEEKWHELRSCLLDLGGSPGSKILVTTRSHRVAAIMQSDFGPYVLQTLPDDPSWILFEKNAFRREDTRNLQEFSKIGRRIVEKCGGLPLAIKAIGRLMRNTDDREMWSMTEREMWHDPNADRVLSVLRRSYDNLPSVLLKKCFESCSMFEKGTLIEKEKLIQVWMAQGHLNPRDANHLTPEDIGNNYFNLLLQNSLLQYPRQDVYDNITHCRMHDFVHELSLSVSRTRYLVIDGPESNHTADMSISDDTNALHLSFDNSAEWEMFKIPKQGLNNLRTFSVVGGGVDLEDVFTNFTELHVLIVEDQDVSNLPETIDKLKHLRFLDISKTRIRFLPQSLTKLHNLQTLRVFDLVELPEAFDKFINLRHFYIEGYCHHPSRNLLLPGIWHLTSLRTLPFFWVSQEKECQMEQLEYLADLGGKLTIYGLQNVKSDASVQKANLLTKLRIQSLELYWEGPSKHCHDYDVLEGLLPHSNLKGLKIVGFQGCRFPSWMVSENQFALHHLVELQLEHLDNFKEIPPLGELACLKILKIDMVQNMEWIKNIFRPKHRDTLESSSIMGEKNVLFPALREFELCRMPRLMNWSVVIPRHLSVEVFPNLEILRLRSLPLLYVLPELGELKCLRQLEVSYCQTLSSLPDLNSLSSLQALVIIHCPSLNGPYELNGLSSLENLCISNCPSLKVLPITRGLPSLQKLQIESCDQLTAFFSKIRTFRSLQFLDIYAHPRLWPADIHYMTSLRSLHIGGFSEDDDSFPWPDSVRSFASLMSLQLYGWPMIKSLPEQMQNLSNLRNLTIIRFDGLEALPEWLGKLRHLQKLELFACQNLKYLPPTAMECLADLHTLRINRCPLLKERCNRGSGEEWPKIAHVPNISRLLHVQPRCPELTRLNPHHSKVTTPEGRLRLLSKRLR